MTKSDNYDKNLEINKRKKTMARILIIVTDKKDYPHYAFREEKMNFVLEDGYTITDAHNVLVDMGVALGKEIEEKRKEQTHARARYLVEEEKIDGETEKERHEKKLCYCYRENKQTDRECHYKNWFDGKLSDRELIAQYEY